MAKCTIVYWQEIPSVVEVRGRDGGHKVQLSARFQELIDMAAMRRGMAEGDVYLAQWRRQRVGERDGDPEDVARQLTNELEARYAAIRAEVLASLGRDTDE